MSHRGRCSQRCCRAAFVTPAVWGVWSPPDVERGPSRLRQADPRAGPHTDYTSPSRHLNLTFGFPAEAPSMRTGSERRAPPARQPLPHPSTRQASWIPDGSHSPPRHCSAGHVALSPSL